MSLATGDVVLPHGAFSDAPTRREATVRAITGHDEAWLGQRRFATQAEASTAILARVVLRLDGARPDAAAIRRLVLGDREALLLHALRLACGERVDAVLACPACREAMDLGLAVDDLMLAPYEDAPPAHETDVDAGEGRRWRATFRLATGADLEAAGSATVSRSSADGARVLLDRCLLAAEDEDGRPLAPPWPAPFAEAVGDAMRARDPQADLGFDLACPACGGAVEAELDAGAFLARRLTTPARLLREVHALALRYHWSERDALALTPQRRAAYLQLLDEDASEDVA